MMVDSDAKAVPGRRREAWADLDLLTPDDVCTLLKVKKSWFWLKYLVMVTVSPEGRDRGSKAGTPPQKRRNGQDNLNI